MPNWCTNRLSITGPEPELQRFQKQARSDGELLTFSSFVPATDGNDARALWGTKWDPDSVKEESTCTRLFYTFDTAWNSPLDWLAAVATELYPLLMFELEYCEPGNSFAGRVGYENGDKTEDNDSIDSTAMEISWYGEVTVCCVYCETDDVTIEKVDDERICVKCFENLCLHCNKMRSDHVNEEKCPFAATTFRSREMAS